jgi:hypothetical protein
LRTRIEDARGAVDGGLIDLGERRGAECSLMRSRNLVWPVLSM